MLFDSHPSDYYALEQLSSRHDIAVHECIEVYQQPDIGIMLSKELLELQNETGSRALNDGYNSSEQHHTFGEKPLAALVD